MDSDLSNVYWVGGANSGGKSTVASILGDRYGLAVYHCDDRFLEHLSRAKQSESPTMYEVNKNEQELGPGWHLDLPFEELTHVLALFKRERFVEAIKDLREMLDKPLITEGVAFRPGRVAEVADVRKAVCLVPTEEFWHAVFSKRNDPLMRGPNSASTTRKGWRRASDLRCGAEGS